MRKFVLGLLIFVSSLASAQVKHLSYKDGYVGSKDFKVKKTITEGSNYIDVTYTFEGVDINEIKSGNKTYQSFKMADGSYLSEKGEPELPVYIDLLAIGSTSNVTVTLKNSSFKEYGNQNIVPSVGQYAAGTNPPAIMEGDIYKKNLYYPGNIVNISSVSTFQDFPLAAVSLVPIQFNPVTKKTRCYSSVTYRLQYSKGTLAPKFSHTSQHLLEMKVANPEFVSRACNATSSLRSSVATQADGYVIVAYQGYKPAVQRFIDWKSKQGFKCTAIYGNPFTVNGIKNELKKIYANQVPAYVVFFGDHETVPAIKTTCRDKKYKKDTVPKEKIVWTDNLYGNINYINGVMGIGNEPVFTPETSASYSYVPDVLLGRISVSSLEEANNVVDKIIKYEKTPPTDASFYKKAIHVGYFEDKWDRTATTAKEGPDGYEDGAFLKNLETTSSVVTNNTDIKNIERIYSYATDYDNSNVVPHDTYVPKDFQNSWKNWGTWKDGGKKLVKAINNGANYAIYSGHGGSDGWAYAALQIGKNDFLKNGIEIPNIYGSTLDELNNGDKLPFMFGDIACHTGTFHDKVCFTEAALRKKNGGAVCITGNANTAYSLNSTEDTRIMVDELFAKKNCTVGEAFHKARFNPFNLMHFSNSPSDAYYCFIPHLFGDPSITMFTQEPICIEPSVKLNGTTVTVDAGESGDFKITLTDALNPSNSSRMKVFYGDNAKFTNVSYPYTVSIQRNEFHTYLGAGANYVQNCTLSKDAEILGDNIYVGSQVKSSSQGPVAYTAGLVNITADKKVFLRKGFKAKASNSSSKLSIKAKRRTCQYGGVYNEKALRSDIDYNYIDGDAEDDMMNENYDIFEVYPNPSEGIFYVNLGEEKAHITVYDSYGRCVYANAAEGNATIDLTGHAKGIYAATIESDNYHVVYRLIKK